MSQSQNSSKGDKPFVWDIYDDNLVLPRPEDETPAPPQPKYNTYMRPILLADDPSTFDDEQHREYLKRKALLFAHSKKDPRFASQAYQMDAGFRGPLHFVDNGWDFSSYTPVIFSMILNHVKKNFPADPSLPLDENHPHVPKVEQAITRLRDECSPVGGRYLQCISQGRNEEELDACRPMRNLLRQCLFSSKLSTAPKTANRMSADQAMTQFQDYDNRENYHKTAMWLLRKDTYLQAYNIAGTDPHQTVEEYKKTQRL